MCTWDDAMDLTCPSLPVAEHVPGYTRSLWKICQYNAKMPGYNYKFLDRLESYLFCPMCRLPMRDPVQITSCRHRFCDTCLQEYLSEGIFKCPEDKLPLDYAKIYPDPECHIEIMTSSVHCVRYEEGCRWVDQLQNLQGHMDQCRYDSMQCPNHCSTIMSRLSLDDHLQYACPRRQVTCEFCTVDFSGDAMEAHQGNCPMETVWCENKCGARLQKRFLSNHMRNECHKRTLPCSYCKKEFVYETLQNHYYQCPRFPISCPNRCEPIKIAREDVEIHLMDSCPSATVPCTFTNVGCKHLCPRYALEKHLDQDARRHLSLLGQLVQSQERKIQDMSERLLTTACITDGTFLWKIADFRSKLTEARGHPSNAEIKSEHFYTSRYGYKLAVSLFPNGNGSGEGTHLSIYIRVVSGEYDNLLEWPFRLPISFKILDQCSDPDKRIDIKESFIPNPSWKHFQKPASNMDSMGFGYPKFVSQETLKSGSYIRDDSIFIKIKVDVSKFIMP